MLHHQDRPVNSAYGRQGGTTDASSHALRNRPADKDGNFNFLPGKDDVGITPMAGNGRGGDENRNQVRPRNLSPLGRDPPTSSSSGFHHPPGILSPRSRLPCWSLLEPLPEIDSGDDGYGRVPPDGAEEGKMEEEETRPAATTVTRNDVKDRETTREGALHRRKDSFDLRGGEEEEEDEDKLEDGDEWGDSDSEFEFSYPSGSVSSTNIESGGEGVLMGGWDRIGVGEPKSQHQGAADPEPTEKWDGCGNREPTARQSCVSRKMTNSLTEEEEEDDDDEDQSSDSDGELPELGAVWTLRDRDRFKAQEMEKHQVQLTMYRRLALIRWVRTLQSRVQEQQNRLQTSFDVILTHRKELLRVGAAAATPTATAVSQS